MLFDGWSQGGRSSVRMKHLTSGSASKHERGDAVFRAKYMSVNVYTASHATQNFKVLKELHDDLSPFGP